MKYIFVTAISVAFASSDALAQSACGSLTGLSLTDTTITIAESVPPGAFRPPGGGSAAPFANLPAFCRVAGTIAPTKDSSIRFEVWMPSSNWNGKFMGVGGSIWSGSISYDRPSATAPGLAVGLAGGYATASTDTGHTGANIITDWAIGHPEKVIDFGYRAVHEMTVKSKAIISSFYGRPPEHSYFDGCSTGGRQGFAEAQMYPADYDGILAGAPGNHMVHFLAGGMAIVQAIHKDPATNIPSSMIPPLNAAIMAACDTQDGVADGILQDPRRCKFDLTTLQCSASNTSNCFTAAQTEGLKKIYAGSRNPRNGEVIFPGIMPGSELAWTGWLGGTNPNVLTFLIASRGFRDVAFEDPMWDWTTFDFDKDLAFAAGKLAHAIDQTNPDLRSFRGLGHKLIQYHGWNDQAISPLNSINYFNGVVAAMGSLLELSPEASLSDTQNYYRLFMIPGMAHCGRGDVAFDAITALDQWVVTGKAPDRIVLSRTTNGQVDGTRALCPYPAVPKWTGSGSPDDQANYVCDAGDAR